MDTKYELNQLLLDECLKENPDYSKIEELLKNGAQPLGAVISSANSNCNNIVYCDIVDQYIDHDFDSEVFPKVTELFLRHGMNVSKPDFPYDECGESNPLWTFAFYSGENALKTLRLKTIIFIPLTSYWAVGTILGYLSLSAMKNPSSISHLEVFLM